MKALITGASSGLGRDMARVLSAMGYDLILTARRGDRLELLKAELPTSVRVISLDLCSQDNCVLLYEMVRDEPINVLINNAGMGTFGPFWQTDLHKELRLLDLNVLAQHVLFKMFLRDFVAHDSGYILNVASSAAFSPGPFMASYYASKSYILNLTMAVREELKLNDHHVCVSALCPGPMATEFDQKAGIRFTSPYQSSIRVAKIAIRKMFDRQLLIIPGPLMKMNRLIARIAPDGLVLKMASRLQRHRNNF